ncbi:DUF3450 family protein [Gayadomonas joobiniege]|uniref:DUF3450 family protein n=1 Tax=Gayadomonas joobiniege TaxID=1234606 RepID=UPI0003795FC3|nr:DUF3450 family protein [Gayadomonas joobiniege]
MKNHKLILLCFSFLSCSLFSAEPESLDELTRQWLALEHQQTELKVHWQRQKPVLKQRMQLLNAELSSLNKLLAASRTTKNEVDLKRNSLLAKQNELEKQHQELQNAMAGLLAKTNSLYPLLPPVLKAQWDKETLSSTQSQNVSSQLQLVLAKLSKLASLQQQISISEDIIKTPNNKEVLVKRLYLGAALAWFSSADGNVKGIGKVIDDQWRWKFDDQMDAKPILDAVAVYEKRQQPEFSLVPVNLSEVNR